MMLGRQSCFAVLVLWAAGPAAIAQTAATPQEPTNTRTFTLRPHLLDSDTTSGAALAIDYDLNLLRTYGTGGNTSVGSPVVTVADADVPIGTGSLALRARGTLASSKVKASNKLVDLTGNALYTLSTTAAWMRAGGQLAFETDQSLENRQVAIGLLGAVSKVQIFTNGDAGSLLLNYATVDPKEDKARKATGVDLQSYRRWNAELSYTLNVNLNKLRSIDLNYRHYQEISAPGPVRAAGLERQRLGLIRLNLDQDFFVQYSSGSLPFDQKTQRAVKAGWSYKFN